MGEGLGGGLLETGETAAKDEAHNIRGAVALVGDAQLGFFTLRDSERQKITYEWGNEAPDAPSGSIGCVLSALFGLRVPHSAVSILLIITLGERRRYRKRKNPPDTNHKDRAVGNLCNTSRHL